MGKTCNCTRFFGNKRLKPSLTERILKILQNDYRCRTSVFLRVFLTCFWNPESPHNFAPPFVRILPALWWEESRLVLLVSRGVVRSFSRCGLYWVNATGRDSRSIQHQCLIRTKGPTVSNKIASWTDFWTKLDILKAISSRNGENGIGCLSRNGC